MIDDTTKCHSCSKLHETEMGAVCFYCEQFYCRPCFGWETRTDASGRKHYFCSWECSESLAS